MFLKQVMMDLRLERKTATIYEDNVGAMNIAENNMASKRTKHIDVRYHHIRELIENGEVKVGHIASEKQIADIMTKNTTNAIFEKHRRTVMNKRGGSKATKAFNREDLED